MNPVLGYLFNALAFAVGALVYFSEAKRRKMDLSRTREVALMGVLVGVLAASIGQWSYGIFAFGSGSESGGRTILAGVLGGWLGVEIAKRRLGIKESTGVLWAVALPAGEAVGRIGCWFHGCCYGRVCTLPWAVHQHDAWRQPTQFYLSAAAAITFVIVWTLRDRTDIFALSLLLWSISRIIIEPLRESSVATPWLVPAICTGIAVYAANRLLKYGKTARSV